MYFSACTYQSEMSTFVSRSLQKYILITKLQQFLMPVFGVVYASVYASCRDVVFANLSVPISRD